jgi:ribosomal protein S27E
MKTDRLVSLNIKLPCVGCGRLVWVTSESIRVAECIACGAVRIAGELERDIAEAALLSGRQS